MASKAVLGDTQRAKLERKEAAILKAARAVFVDHGFDGARMSEIARQAGIGEGTIYSYYESKAELMLAVLEQFWDGLTAEAKKVMAGIDSDDVFVRLEALARYHLNIVIRNADFINLTFALRRNNSEVNVSRDHMRNYAAVFDDIFRRGQDRGELAGDAILWQARDVFYGTLEYSARSIDMTRGSQAMRQQAPVIDNMIELFRSHYGQAQTDIGKESATSLEQIDQKISRIEALLSKK